MKSFRKVSVWLVSGVLMLSMAGCAEKKEETKSPEPETTTTATIAEITGEIDLLGTDASGEASEDDGSLSKAQIQSMEKEYLESENVFQITSVMSVGGSSIVMGKPLKGSFSKNQIVEYIDKLGQLRKTCIAMVESTESKETVDTSIRTAGLNVTGTSLGMSRTSYLFKRESYKGLFLSIPASEENKTACEDFFNEHKSFQVQIDGGTYDVQLVSSGLSSDQIALDVVVIFDKDFPFEVLKKVTISDLGVDGLMAAQVT